MKRLSAFTVLITLAVSMLGTIVIQGMQGCTDTKKSDTPSLHDQVTQATAPAQQENDLLKKQVDTLTKQNAMLIAAVDMKTKTGTFIDQAIALCVKAMAEAGASPSAVATLTNQHDTLDQGKASNDDLGKKLAELQAENKALATNVAAFTTANANLRVQLQALSDASDAKDKEVAAKDGQITDLTNNNADLKKKLAKKDEDDIRKSLLWALSICVVLAAGGVFVAIKSDPALGIAMTGAGLAGVGLSLFCIIYAVQIAIVMGVAATIALLAFGYIAYNKFHVDSSSIVKSVQAAIAAGKVKLEDVTGIFDSVQTPAAKKFVDTVTRA